MALLTQGCSAACQVLIDSAGVAVLRWDVEAYEISRAVHYDGPVLLTQKLVPHMVPGGTIIQVSSSTSKLECAGCSQLPSVRMRGS